MNRIYTQGNKIAFNLGYNALHQNNKQISLKFKKKISLK